MLLFSGTVVLDQGWHFVLLWYVACKGLFNSIRNNILQTIKLDTSDNVLSEMIHVETNRECRDINVSISSVFRYGTILSVLRNL